MLSGGARIEMEVKALQQMMAQLWQMQENLEQRRGEIRVEATAGGGMVSVKMNGQKQLTEVKIEPEVFAGKDQEMLRTLCSPREKKCRACWNKGSPSSPRTWRASL